jgi:4-amino-4-deoxy-L-arabinose transferase-like glycosyltransferase
MRLPRNTTAGAGWRTLLAPFDPIHFLKTCWSMRPFTAIFAATAVALPWYWAVGIATDGEFLRTFFFEHNLARATSAMENHNGSILFYPATLLIGFFPWSIFALPLAIDTFLQLRHRPLTSDLRPPSSSAPTPSFHPGYVLAVCWIGVYVILFSLARTKLPSYVTPCYPALALLMGDYIDRWSRQRAAVAGRWLVAAFLCLGLVGVGIAAAIPVVARQHVPGEEWLGLIGLVPIVGCVACIGFVAVRSYFASAGALAMTAVGFVLLMFAVGVERIDQHQTNHQLLQAIHARSAHPQVASYRVLEPSWVFYGRFLVREFLEDRRFGPGHAAAAATQFLAQSPDHFLITTSDKLREISPPLPLGIGVIEQTPYFLHGKQQLVLLGPLTGPTRAARSANGKLKSSNDLR